MRTFWLTAAVAATGCTSRGRVDVYVYDTPSFISEAPTVAFQDVDGDSRSEVVDGDHHVIGELEAGGTVWVGRCTQSGCQFSAYTDVETGSTLTFGLVPETSPAPTATMHITAAVPAGEFNVQLFVSCGTYYVSEAYWQLDDRCGTTVDVLAIGIHRYSMTTYVPETYAYLPAQSIVEGGTIDIPESMHEPLDDIRVEVSGTDAMSPAQLTMPFGNGGFYTQLTGASGALAGKAPLIGRPFRVSLSASNPVGGQSVTTNIAAAATTTIDLSTMLAPWLSYEHFDYETVTWTSDDAGGALHADLMLAHYNWQQPIANFEHQNTATVISPAAASGTVPDIALPDVFEKDQPGPDFMVAKRVQLVRIESSQQVDRLNIAEQLLESSTPTGLAADDIGASIAVSP